jgi:hypothetical protein
MENNHPVLSQLNQEIQDLNEQVVYLRSERDRIQEIYSGDVENIRLILLEAIAEDIDVQTVANSVADVLGISLLREISVTFTVAVEASMLVPADFDISDFDVTNVSMEAWNSEVEDFVVQSFEMADVEES